MESIIFSIIICGYDEEGNLKNCIESCLNQQFDKKSYEIIYVDGNSTDKSLEIAKKFPVRTIIEKRRGLSEARNTGIKIANGDYLIFLDADTELFPNYLELLKNSFIGDEVGASGGKVLPLIPTWISNYLGVSLLERYPRYISWKYVNTYPGCNLTIRKDVLDKVGHFKEELVSSKGITRFGEDKEICERIRQEGYKILYNPHATLYHKNVYQFKDLFNIWVKGSKGRLNLINAGAKDNVSIFFKYNIPLLYLSFAILLLHVNSFAFLSFIVMNIIITMSLSLKIFLNTSLFFESFFVKPILDPFCLLVINSSIFWYKYGGKCNRN